MVSELGSLPKDLPQAGKLTERGPFSAIEKFLEAVNDAKAGQLITLKNGEYTVKEGMNTKFKERIGNADKPIIVRAEEPGKVILKGSKGYRFVDCKYLTWYGFKHIHGDNITFEGGRNNRFARCEIQKDEESEKDNWLYLTNCKAMKVDHCFFHDKLTEGTFCNIESESDNKIGDGPLIEYNHFRNQDYGKHLPPGVDYGDAGGEAIKIGGSGQARILIRAIFRYNFLELCNGDGEIITNKSCGNLYYNNSFVDSDGALSLRHGDSTCVLSNYFKNCGLGINGADNLIANNHFTENSRKDNRQPIVIKNGNVDRPKGPYPKDPKDPDKKFNYERVVNNDIILNTIANVDGTAAVLVYWGSGGRKLKPGENRFMGNIITGKHGTLLQFDNDAKASGEYTDTSEGKKETVKYSNKISDNVGWGDGRKGDEYFGRLTKEMADRIDPQLEKNEDGIYCLRSDSKARSKFEGTPFEDKTDVDIYGVRRTEHTDAGCHQFSTESNAPKRPITRDDVGLGAWTDLGDDSPEWKPHPEKTEK
jgi:hypothetical protein